MVTFEKNMNLKVLYISLLLVLLMFSTRGSRQTILRANTQQLCSTDIIHVMY